MAGAFSYPTVLGRERKHQTQKPVDLMAKICQIAWKNDSVILDPFAGSGSTLVAAKALKKRAIGIELNQKYCEDIAERLRN